MLAALMALALDSMKLHGTKFFRISTFLPYAVPAVVSTLIWAFMYGAKYGLVGSLNAWFGTHIDVLAPSVLLAAIGNIVTWGVHGLQHAHLLLEPVHHSPTAFTKLRPLTARANGRYVKRHQAP